MSAIDKLDSPFLNEQIDTRAPADETVVSLEHEVARSPFVDSLELGEEESAMDSDEAGEVDEAEWEQRVDESPDVELWTPETDETTLLIGPEPVEEADDDELEELYGQPPLVAEEQEELHFEDETYAPLNTRLKSLSLLAHFVEQGGTKAKLNPLNPGFYDGAVKYKIASPLQKHLETVMKKEFSHINVALVDLTKSASQPEFAGFKHKQNVSVENISKIAPMLAAYQLRADLRVALDNKGLSSLPDLFDKVRDDWAATQLNMNPPAKPFAGTIALRRDLVLFKGATVPLADPKSPNLERIFKDIPAGDPALVDFSSTGEDDAQLEQLGFDLRDAKPGGQAKIDGLGFRERLQMMMKASSRASNYAASTVIADIGYLYIASTLLQYGLFDPARGGGLWLASNFARRQWSAGAAIGGLLNANPGSVAAFFTLLVQNQLVDRDASAEMRTLLTEDLAPAIPSRSLSGLQKLPDMGSLNSILSRTGISPPAMYDCAVVERRPNPSKDDIIHYIAVGLNSLKSAEWISLIGELDRCIQANNSVMTPEPEEEFETDGSETEPESEDEKGIIGGTDERMPVKDARAVPFRWICQIWIQYRINSESGKEIRKSGLAPLATGVLISPRHVLTAAHVLHDIDESGSVREEHIPLSIEVAPAANGRDAPFGRIEAKSWKTASKWKPGSGSSQWDYALITLEDAVGEQKIKNWNDNKPLSNWGSTSGGAGTSLDAVPPALLRTLLGARVGTAGYPASAKGKMICAAGVFSAGVAEAALTSSKRVEDWIKSTGTFFITADASAGQSGAPVWILDGGKRYMIGILAAVGDNYNTVVNLRSAAVSEIRSWITKS